MPLLLYKLGGSLLARADWPGRLQELFARHPTTPPVVLIGGGAVADAVRAWDDRLHLGATPAHWLALQGVAVNEALLRTVCPEFVPVRSGSQVHKAIAAGRPAMICLSCFCRWGESQPGPHPPHGWETTTDTLAAWSAGLLQADELVLVKSIACPQGFSAVAAAQQGWIDPESPRWLTRLPRVAWANLTAETPSARTPQPWLP